MDFQVVSTRLTFRAEDEISLPEGEETNVFRGALGLALRKRAGESVYARFFEPRWSGGPSGYRDAPRPFVLRWGGPSERRLAPSTAFFFDLNLFEAGAPPLKELEAAFREMAAAGLGRGRGKAAFESLAPPETRRLILCGEEGKGQVNVEFVTPTELKRGGEVLGEPDFASLVQRLAERVWALGRLYQNWTGDWDYRGLLDRSREVRLVEWDWRYQHRERRSSRTGQRHPLGGFSGRAVYEGPVGVFLPLLEIGRWTGVGRQTVWGKGEIRVSAP